MVIETNRFLLTVIKHLIMKKIVNNKVYTLYSVGVWYFMSFDKGNLIGGFLDIIE